MSSLQDASRRKRIKSLVRRDETIVRVDVHACNYYTTWGADDNQYMVFADGVDIHDPLTQAYHSRIHRIVGDAPAPVMEELPG